MKSSLWIAATVLCLIVAGCDKAAVDAATTMSETDSSESEVSMEANRSSEAEPEQIEIGHIDLNNDGVDEEIFLRSHVH